MPSITTFGAEFECFIPAGTTRQDLAQAISARLGNPNACRIESYGHQAHDHWKVVTDGSLIGSLTGVEVVSRAMPPLQGEEGIEEMRKVCEALQDFGCTVNSTAGMHVHVKTDGMSLGFFKKLVRLYQTYEPVIDAMMPASRRGSRNSYCRTLASASPIAINQASSLTELAELIRRATGAGEQRYHKVNVTAAQRHGTVEFRQHSGTVDADKSEKWVRLCLQMVEAAKNPTIVFDAPAPRAIRNTARFGSKRHQIVELILRDGGATRTEIVTATNWPSVSIAQIAASIGLDIVTTRTGRETRYRINAAAVTATAHDVSIDGFCRLIGATDGLREYIRRRSGNLSGAIAWAA